VLLFSVAFREPLSLSGLSKGTAFIRPFVNAAKSTRL
jgi:hypothetical protein